MFVICRIREYGDKWLVIQIICPCTYEMFVVCIICKYGDIWLLMQRIPPVPTNCWSSTDHWNTFFTFRIFSGSAEVWWLGPRLNPPTFIPSPSARLPTGLGKLSNSSWRPQTRPLPLRLSLIKFPYFLSFLPLWGKPLWWLPQRGVCMTIPPQEAM